MRINPLERSFRRSAISTLGVLIVLVVGFSPGPAWALSWQLIGPEPITQAPANFGGD